MLLVAVVWGSSCPAANGTTTARSVLAVLVPRFAVVLPVLVVVGRRRLRALGAAGFGFTTRVRIALLVHDAGLLDDDGAQPSA